MGRRAAWVLVLLLAVVIACSAPPPPPPAPPTVGPAALQGLVDQHLAADHSGRFDNLRAVLAEVDGKVVVTRQLRGTPDTSGDVYSITKSVVATLTGIAISEGAIPSLDARLADLLPTHAAAMTAAQREATLRQLLTMNAGLAPSLKYTPPELDAVDAMLANASQLPGSGFDYSEASYHVLGAVVADRTGRPLLDYAREKLFDPLGIPTTGAEQPRPGDRWFSGAVRGWAVDPQGRNIGYSHLALTADDLLRLGRLWRDSGAYQGRQLVPAGFIAAMTKPQIDTGEPGWGYGYGMWLVKADGHDAFGAMGSGGQMIEVVPDLRLIVVVASDAATAQKTEPDYYAQLVDTTLAPALAPH